MEELEVSEDKTDQIDEFLYQLHRQIKGATEHTSPLERIVRTAELLVDQLVALTLYTFPHHTNGLTNSIKTALRNIELLFDKSEIP